MIDYKAPLKDLYEADQRAKAEDARQVAQKEKDERHDSLAPQLEQVLKSIGIEVPALTENHFTAGYITFTLRPDVKDNQAETHLRWYVDQVALMEMARGQGLNLIISSYEPLDMETQLTEKDGARFRNSDPWNLKKEIAADVVRMNEVVAKFFDQAIARAEKEANREKYEAAPTYRVIAFDFERDDLNEEIERIAHEPIPYELTFPPTLNSITIDGLKTQLMLLGIFKKQPCLIP